jgi:hypothetical protein
VSPYRTRFDLDLELEFALELKVVTSRCPNPDEVKVEGELEPDVRRTTQLPTNVQSV